MCVFLLELYTLLLEDILVLLQKQDERLVLKCHSKNRAGSADAQHIFSPVIKLNTVLVRSVATGKLFYTHTHTHTHTKMGNVANLTLCFHKQTTGPSLCSPCRTAELRSMNWWLKQCLNRECKCWDCHLSTSGFFSIFFPSTFHFRTSSCLHLSFPNSTSYFHSFVYSFSLRWQRHIIQRAEAMKSRPHNVIPLPQSE